MITNPIIPVWLMVIICVGFLFLKRKGMLNYIRHIFIVLLLFIINLRIMIPGGEFPSVTQNVDIMFVVDNTISMIAEDYDGNGRRIDAVKNDCKYIIEQFPGASYSVVTFDSTVNRLMPYTVDANMVIDSIEVLNGQTKLYAAGTSLNEVMSKMKNILNSDKDSYKVLFFISDGEITNEEKLKSHSGLNQYVDGGAVLGYGTTSGGKMKPLYYAGDEEEPEYLTYYDDNFDKKEALSKIDESNLKSIASDFGIRYVHMTSQSQIHNTISELQNKVKNLDVVEDKDSMEGYEDIYYIFVIPLLILLIIDYIYYRRRI